MNSVVCLFVIKGMPSDSFFLYKSTVATWQRNGGYQTECDPCNFNQPVLLLHKVCSISHWQRKKICMAGFKNIICENHHWQLDPIFYRFDLTWLSQFEMTISLIWTDRADLRHIKFRGQCNYLNIILQWR